MLYLCFQCEGQRCAFRAAQIVEIVPLVELRPVPGGRGGVFAGVMTYRSEAVPVADLGQLLAGRPAVRRCSSRIFLVQLDAGLVGLLAESVCDTCRVEETDFIRTSAMDGRFLCAGRAARLSDGLLLCFSVDDIKAMLTDAGASGGRDARATVEQIHE